MCTRQYGRTAARLCVWSPNARLDDRNPPRNPVKCYLNIFSWVLQRVDGQFSSALSPSPTHPQPRLTTIRIIIITRRCTCGRAEKKKIVVSNRLRNNNIKRVCTEWSRNSQRGSVYTRVHDARRDEDFRPSCTRKTAKNYKYIMYCIRVHTRPPATESINSLGHVTCTH